MVVDICITAYILTEKGDVFMNEQDKLLRLLNQQWDYNSTNKTFISRFSRLYGTMPDLIYIRNGRARYGEILGKLFKRNKCKTNFNWSRQLNITCDFPDELSYMYYLFYSLATPMLLKSNIMHVFIPHTLQVPCSIASGDMKSIVNTIPYDISSHGSSIKKELISRNCIVPYLQGDVFIGAANLPGRIYSVLEKSKKEIDLTYYIIDRGSWHLNNKYTEIFYVLSFQILVDASPYPKTNLMGKINALYGMLLLSRLYVVNILQELNDTHCPDNVKALEECLYYKWLELVYSMKIGQNITYAKNYCGQEDAAPYLFDNPIIPGPTWSHDLRKMLNEDLNVLNSLCGFAESIYANLYHRVLTYHVKDRSMQRAGYVHPRDLSTILTWLTRELYNDLTEGKPLHSSVFHMIPSFKPVRFRSPCSALTCKYGHVVNLKADNTMSEYYSPGIIDSFANILIRREENVIERHRKMPKVNGIPFLWSDDTFNPLANDPWYKEGIQKKYMLPNDKPEWLGSWSFLSEYIEGILKWDIKYGTEWSGHLNYII